MNYIKNSFIKGKHPDICPDCKEEPTVTDINMPFTNAELWIVQCKCIPPYIKAVTGDSISEAVLNWNKLIAEHKKKSRQY